MIMETAIDLVLINWIVDKIEIRDRGNGKENDEGSPWGLY